jgi:Recombination endonuclease VII
MCAMKRCTKCGELKPKSEFYAAKGTKDGLRGDCKQCHIARSVERQRQNPAAAVAASQRWRAKNLDKVREYQRAYRAAHAREAREGHLRRAFGMSVDDYSAILAAQQGGCAICGDQPEDGKSLHIDHNDDGVRGILCVRCNNALGQFKDDPELMLRAAEYTALGGFAPLWLVRETSGVAT